jgi:hypothetical protein
MFEGDPERKATQRKYTKDPHPVKVKLLETLLEREFRAVETSLESLIQVWTQPLRTPDHLRNWKFQLEREWPEFYDAVDKAVQAAMETDPEYQEWLKDNKVQERKS